MYQSIPDHIMLCCSSERIVHEGVTIMSSDEMNLVFPCLDEYRIYLNRSPGILFPINDILTRRLHELLLYFTWESAEPPFSWSLGIYMNPASIRINMLCQNTTIPPYVIYHCCYENLILIQKC